MTPERPGETPTAEQTNSIAPVRMATMRSMDPMELRDPGIDLPSWTFLTNHAHVLITLHRNPELRQRDIAHAVGITVGAVQKILHELEDAGFVSRERVGRRNRYEVNADIPLRHPLENGHNVRDLLLAVD